MLKAGRSPFQPMIPADPRENVFHAGVRAYLAHIRDAPPATREALEEQIQWMDPSIQNPIFEAIWWNGYDKFKNAVAEERKKQKE